ncbi:MAG: tRNA 2-thiouridine(34) synthase MnmA, partial [Candidatus Omnitrophota bacterium]
MSGGVDSSVAASLLCAQGHEVVGLCIRSWPSERCGTEGKKSCYAPDDARSVAS